MLDSEDKKTICFQIDRQDFEDLKVYAKRTRKSTISWVLRNLVSELIKQNKKK